MVRASRTRSGHASAATVGLTPLWRDKGPDMGWPGLTRNRPAVFRSLALYEIRSELTRRDESRRACCTTRNANPAEPRVGQAVCHDRAARARGRRDSRPHVTIS
jgi:glycine/D-amino acid oxidase-like deaminating enzyme